MKILLVMVIIIVIVYFMLKPSVKKLDVILKTIIEEIKTNFDINKLGTIESGYDTQVGWVTKIEGYSYETNKGLVQISGRYNCHCLKINDEWIYKNGPSNDNTMDFSMDLHIRIYKYLEYKYEHKDDALLEENRKIGERIKAEKISNLQKKYGK